MPRTQGQIIAASQASLRHRIGPEAFTYAGNTVDCSSKSMDISGGEMQFEGPLNAANADVRTFSLNPTDFTAPPTEGSDCTYGGVIFTIYKVPPVELMYGVPVCLRVVAYRKPQGGSATTITPTEAVASGEAAGTRKVYTLPPSAV